MTKRLCCAVAVALAMIAAPAVAQIPAFPGADGAARNVTGGRGGIVYHVTKLDSAIDDPQRNDLGTLRYGLNNSNFPSGVPRTIVFDVGGVFHLGRLPQVDWNPNGNGWDSQSRLTVGGTNITIAGQTAPGAGVIFMGGGLKPQGSNNIIRNVTVAAGYGMRNWYDPGDPYPPVPPAVPPSPGPGIFPDATVYDALDIAGTNIMIDHVSTLFATDESISMNEVANNITVQYSNISQGQNYPQWDPDVSPARFTGHALGSLLEAGANASISFHHNLYAHEKGRVPQIGGGATNSPAFYDFRNNVFYNWFSTAGTKGGTTRLNLVNNFYLAGPGGEDPVGGTNTGITTVNGGTGVIGASSTVYRVGNMLDSNKDGDANDGSLLSSTGSPANPLFLNSTSTYAGASETAVSAFNRVLDYMGANWWMRDNIIDTPDERIIHETRTGTGKVMAWADNPWNNDPNEGQEWRDLVNTPEVSRAPEWDTEASVGYGVGDGMPTYWETIHGLAANARDDTADFDQDGYTNLEEYLNDVAAWPAPNAIMFDPNSNGRFAEILNWDANPDPNVAHGWQPSRYDAAVVRSGLVVVDAVGQHAGGLIVAPFAGDSATLRVSSGWLRVADTLELGAEGTSGVLELQGTGQLHVHRITSGANGSIEMTGGLLNADIVEMSLENNGGTIAPGQGVFDLVNHVIDFGGVDSMEVVGNLVINSGLIQFDIAGNQQGEYDFVDVSGALTGGGTLQVLLDGYTPVLDDVFKLFDFTSAGGEFVFDLPGLDEGLQWDYSQVLTTGELSVIALVPQENADFNGDEIVDGSDFLVWQIGLGSTGQTDNSAGDANFDGTVDADDLVIWEAQYGNPPPPLSASAMTVPEPSSLLLALGAMAGLRRRRR